MRSFILAQKLHDYLVSSVMLSGRSRVIADRGKTLARRYFDYLNRIGREQCARGVGYRCLSALRPLYRIYAVQSVTMAALYRRNRQST